jgi:hypothetical protein
MIVNGYGLDVMVYGLKAMGSGLRAMGYGLKAMGKDQKKLQPQAPIDGLESLFFGVFAKTSLK